jgi:hypothetical protein
MHEMTTLSFSILLWIPVKWIKWWRSSICCRYHKCFTISQFIWDFPHWSFKKKSNVWFMFWNSVRFPEKKILDLFCIEPSNCNQFLESRPSDLPLPSYFLYQNLFNLAFKSPPPPSHSFWYVNFMPHICKF